MRTYQGALDEIRQYGGRWEVFKMRCFSAWIGIEAWCLPKISRARGVRAMGNSNSEHVDVRVEVTR